MITQILIYGGIALGFASVFLQGACKKNKNKPKDNQEKQNKKG